jgi:hypothetical protein
LVVVLAVLLVEPQLVAVVVAVAKSYRIIILAM